MESLFLLAFGEEEFFIAFAMACSEAFFNKLLVLKELEVQAEVIEDPEETGAPGEIRTPDPLVRSQMLYPAELRAREAILPKIAGGAVGCGFRSRRREGTVSLQFRSAAIRRIAAARRARLGGAWVRRLLTGMRTKATQKSRKAAESGRRQKNGGPG
jgi:hypothetical protein